MPPPSHPEQSDRPFRPDRPDPTGPQADRYRHDSSVTAIPKLGIAGHGAGTIHSRNRYTSTMSAYQPPAAPENAPASWSRRAFLGRVTTLTGLVLIGRNVSAQVAQPPAARSMTVYKDPGCGCCSDWIEHVKKAGFSVAVRDSRDMDSVKASLGVPTALASCHTARIGSYVIEGHVPADLIVRLLKEQPAARGLAVPGMPVGSPGMEIGSRKDPYNVLLFDKAGKTRIYASR